MRDPHGQQRYTAVILVAATLLAFTGRAAADEADDAARPLLAAAKEAVADGRLTQSKVLGFNLGKVAFSESPEDGGVLIGFDLGLGKFLDIENIYALRAVYLTRSGEVTTKEHGLFHDKVQAKNKVVKTKVLRTVHLRASPGYAVGGVTLRSGLNINGLSVTFMRIHDRRLDTNHSMRATGSATAPAAVRRTWAATAPRRRHLRRPGRGKGQRPRIVFHKRAGHGRCAGCRPVGRRRAGRRRASARRPAPRRAAASRTADAAAGRPAGSTPASRRSAPAPPQQAFAPATVPTTTAAPCAGRAVVGPRLSRLRSAAGRLPCRGRLGSRLRAVLVQPQDAARSG